jgi:hypothetical protein
MIPVLKKSVCLAHLSKKHVGPVAAGLFHTSQDLLGTPYGGTYFAGPLHPKSYTPAKPADLYRETHRKILLETKGLQSSQVPSASHYTVFNAYLEKCSHNFDNNKLSLALEFYYKAVDHAAEYHDSIEGSGNALAQMGSKMTEKLNKKLFEAISTGSEADEIIYSRELKKLCNYLRANHGIV